jgi:hypothetical protein
MGNFYGNITLRTDDRAGVMITLGALRRDAYVVSTPGFVVVYDREELDRSRLNRLLLKLSEHFACVGFAVAVGDDDVLEYGLADRGRLVDEYDSNPGYDTGRATPPRGGDAARLCAAFGRIGRQEAVRAILHDLSPTLEVERHQALIEALDLPDAAVGMGFAYIADGQSEDAGLTDVARVGRAPER